jgi:hypothetical protein
LLEDDGIDARASEELPQRRARRTRADDRHLDPHALALLYRNDAQAPQAFLGTRGARLSCRGLLDQAAGIVDRRVVLEAARRLEELRR